MMVHKKDASWGSVRWNAEADDHDGVEAIASQPEKKSD
jgi:hypothetical protein